MTNDFEKGFRYRQPSRRTTPGRTGFVLRQLPDTERSIFPGKIKPPCSGVTATRQSVTASGRNG